MKKIIHKIGERFGKLVLVEECGVKRGQIAWKCLCDCGSEAIVLGYNLRTGRTRSCGCGSKENREGSLSPKWCGYKDITGSYWCEIKHRCLRKNRDFNVSMEYAYEIFEQQNKRCALTGVKIGFSGQNNKEDMTASIDRIDNSKGYIEGNIRWVHKKINVMRNNMTDEEFINWCKLIAEYNK